MKHLRLFLAAAFLAVLTACATGPLSGDFNSSAANILQGADAAVTTARTLLRVKKIEPDDAESLLKAAELAKEGVAIARVTRVKQGDAAGTARLRLAADSIDNMNAYLAQKGK